jgi:hypothetical protein
MATPAYLTQSQAFRPSLSSQPIYTNPINVPSIYDRDAIKPVGTPYSATSSRSAIVIRGLPLNTSEESLRLMAVFSKELIDVEVLSLDQTDEAGFRTAMMTFKTSDGAREAKMMLDGKSNVSNDAKMRVEILGSSPRDFRYTIDTTGLPSASTDSSAASSANSSRQANRFNGPYPSRDKVSPPMNGFGGGDLGNPDSTPHYQKIFSPSSPIGNHLNERTRISGKTLINNDSLDDDDETGELLKDPVAYAEHGAMQQQRRATIPHLPISRMAGLSLNAPAAPGPASMPPYGQNGISHPMSAHGAAMSPPSMSGQSPIPFNHHHRGHNFPPVNPADQNPPCNTLYVGNLPIDTSEEELKAMFSKQRGYKRLCFRTKQNGPMCFVEFEDVSFATKALHELYGHPLHNSVKGGIRLSFSKNPLGVRSSQNMGQTSPGALGGGLSGLSSPNGFASAAGPPPGLSAPPGLSMGRLGYSSSNAYSTASYTTQASSLWNTPNYGSAMTAGGPPSMMGGGTSNFQSAYMMGR